MIKSYNLTSGATNSCGCLSKEIKSKNGKRNKKYNQYDTNGDYGICYTFKNEPIFFDLEDYDKIKSYCWHLNCKGYAYASDIDSPNKHVFMHNIVMDNLDMQFIVDHIHHTQDGDNSSCDNRKNNLRKTTQSRNCVNKKKQKNNTSGVVGVRQRKDNGKWIADIDMDKRHYYLGQYYSFEEAVKARKEAELKYHKEYSPKTYGQRDY